MHDDSIQHGLAFEIESWGFTDHESVLNAVVMHDMMKLSLAALNASMHQWCWSRWSNFDVVRGLWFVQFLKLGPLIRIGRTAAVVTQKQNNSVGWLTGYEAVLGFRNNLAIRCTIIIIIRNYREFLTSLPATCIKVSLFKQSPPTPTILCSRSFSETSRPNI